jgi:hypothetical protein
LAFEDLHGHWSVLSLNRGRGKFSFCMIKSSGPLTKLKTSLVRPSSVNFCQHF